MRAAASNPSVATARNKTVHTGGLISWRRRRDSSGGTGAVPPPARGTKKPFTGWFFPATGGSFPSRPSFFYAARKRDRKCDLFFVAEKEGFEPSRQSPQPTPLAGEPLTATWVLLHGYIAGAMLNYLAEREGFEPPVPCGITGFQDQLLKPLGHLSIALFLSWKVSRDNRYIIISKAKCQQLILLFFKKITTITNYPKKPLQSPDLPVL